MRDEQFWFSKVMGRMMTGLQGEIPIPSISECVLDTTPVMLISTYSPSLYYPYKMVVRKLKLSVVRNTRISSASVPAVA